MNGVVEPPGRSPPWRWLDTGLQDAASNIALDRALLEVHRSGKAPHTLRFLRFTPSALIGFHQDVEQELDLEYCRGTAIEVQRRITGGGAIYLDEGQLGWELYLDRRAVGCTDMSDISARLCEAAAHGIRSLGVDACYRPRNDIEVDGRKISGTGGVFDGDSLLFQGTLLLDFDVESMVRVLRVPEQKLSDKAISSAAQRVTSLKALLGGAPDTDQIQRCLIDAFADTFGVSFEPGNLTSAERVAFQSALCEVQDDDWVWQPDGVRAEAALLEGMHRCPGGTIHVHVLMDPRTERVRQVWFNGDFFVSPRRTIPDLEAALRDASVRDLASRIRGFFEDRPVDMHLMQGEDFLAAVRAALHQAPALAAADLR